MEFTDRKRLDVGSGGGAAAAKMWCLAQYLFSPAKVGLELGQSKRVHMFKPQAKGNHILCLMKGAAKKLVIEAMKRIAHSQGTIYGEIIRSEDDERRALHDDISVVVIFFNHTARRRRLRDQVTQGCTEAFD
ncbi:hypothetical protein PIB30_055359 [Stylosanthes scabra]|uniref:Uncharacterized protein n=1 Tax=Stylosanthes scabra TaxID=79078 RepID=A0ABU6YHW6_9FABA|nr:hypothetical protein [Stylosanthes scabra]